MRTPGQLSKHVRKTIPRFSAALCLSFLFLVGSISTVFERGDGSVLLAANPAGRPSVLADFFHVLRTCK